MTCPANRRPRQGFDRTSRQAIDPNIFTPQINRQIADRGFERGFRHPHDIVIRRDAISPKIGQGDQGSAIGHHRAHGAGNFRKRKGRDQHRIHKGFMVNLHILPRQGRFISIGQRVDNEINPVPILLQPFRHGIGRAFNANVIFHGERAAQAFGQRQNTFRHHLILIGEGEFCASIRGGFGNAVSDGFIIGDPHNQAALSC